MSRCEKHPQAPALLACSLARFFALACLALCSVACDSSAIPTSQGTGKPIERGALLLLASDYRSTNLSVRTATLELLTGSLFSTGSHAAGLSYALSGDVAISSESLATGADVALLDRYGTNVLTYVNPATGLVRAQLAVGTGFESNPQDILPWNDSKAFISRYGVDPQPGDAPFDGGSDLIVVDPRVPAIVGRIPFVDKAGVPARPSALTRHGEHAVVTLQRLSHDFSAALDGDLALVRGESLEVEQVLPLPNLRNCGKAVFSQAGKLAIACSGLFDSQTTRFGKEGAAIIVATLETTGVVIEERWNAAALNVSPAGHVAWVSETTLVFDSYGSGQTGDALYTLHRGDPSAREIYRARKPFTIGALRCSSGAFTRCRATVAEPRFVLDITGDLLHHSATATEHSAADITGLPLRGLGIFDVTTP